MALKKNKKGQMEATDQFGKLGEDYSAPSQQVGNVKLSKEEYQAAKSAMGFESGKGGMITPQVEQLPAVQQNLVQQNIPSPTLQQYQTEQKKEEEKLQTETTQAAQDVNLNPSVPQGTIGQIVDKTPVLGTVAETLGTVFRGKRDFMGSEPRTLATADLTNVEYQVINEGVDNNLKFGAVIESLPIVGSLVNKYARGLINTPSGQIDDLSSQLIPLRKQAVNYQAIAKLSPTLRQQALNNIEEIELQIQAIESKIRLTANYSAEARANPEKLDLIELNLKNTRLALAKSKYNIRNGIDESAMMSTPDTTQTQ
jgi:hypothetical protein